MGDPGSPRRIWRVAVGQIGGLDIAVPVVSVGNGSPSLTFLSGVHGDEGRGLFVLHELLRRIEQDPALVGTVHIAYCVNAMAFAEGSRVSRHDGIDLNRVGLGNAEGTLGERAIAGLTKQLLAASDFVIDVHQLEMMAGLVAVRPVFGPPEVQKRAKQALAALQPDLVWSPIMDGGDHKYLSILTFELSRQGVPSLMLELPPGCERDSPLLERAVDRLFNVASLLGVVDRQLARTDRYDIRSLAVHRMLRTTGSAGLFDPLGQRRIGEPIRQGDPVGTLTLFDTWDSMAVESDLDGVLMELRERSIVGTGTGLYSIGTRDEEATEELREIQEQVFAP